MTLRIADRVVLFDYGEVISLEPSPEARAALVRLAEVSTEAFWPAYWELRDDLDRGVLSTTEYWDAIGERVGAEWSPARVQQLYVADFTSWITVNPDVVDIIDELSRSGTRLALLSNAGFDYGDHFRFAPLGRYFERVFVSAELGMLKPEAEIYETVVAEFGMDASRVVFIDNREVNIDGARAVGLTGHVFRGATELRAFLEELSS